MEGDRLKRKSLHRKSGELGTEGEVVGGGWGGGNGSGGELRLNILTDLRGS